MVQYNILKNVEYDDVTLKWSLCLWLGQWSPFVRISPQHYKLFAMQFLYGASSNHS